MEASDGSFPEPIGDDQRQGPRETVCWHGELLAGHEADACTVLDISPYGARVLSAARIAIDLPVLVNLGDRGVYSGLVRWHDSGVIGIKFTAGLREEDRIVPSDAAAGNCDDLGAKVYEWRSEPRRDVAREALLRTGGGRDGCRILDLSPSGARVLATKRLKPGTAAVLSIGSDSALRGRVVWAIGEICGLKFDRRDEGFVQRQTGGA